jgi:hypothetical protein
MLRRVVYLKLTGVSEVFTASIIRATHRDSSPFIIFIRNVSKFITAPCEKTKAKFGFVCLAVLEVKTFKITQTTLFICDLFTDTVNSSNYSVEW